jgi:hypothetical protein
MITELEAEKEALSAQIAEKLIQRGYMGSDGTTRKVRISATNRSSINKTKLVDLGVPISTIEAATEHSVSYAVRVDKVKPSGD